MAKGRDDRLNPFLMATTLLQARDEEIFRALDSGPLTVRQLLKLSVTFSRPFGSERYVQTRLKVLADAGLLQRFPYLSGDRSVVFYYTLSTESFRLLYGEDVPVPRSLGDDIGVARQHHTRCLADFAVHTAVAAHKAGFQLVDVHRENTLRLEVDGRSLYPDRTFTVIAPDRPSLHFFVELDNGTEPIASPRERDSWLKKLAFYEAFQDVCGYRFRVLGINTKTKARLDHILMTAAAVSRDPQRPLFYGVGLADYLSLEQPLEAACFRNHKGQAVALVPALAEAHVSDVPMEMAQALVG